MGSRGVQKVPSQLEISKRKSAHRDLSACTAESLVARRFLIGNDNSHPPEVFSDLPARDTGPELTKAGSKCILIGAWIPHAEGLLAGLPVSSPPTPKFTSELLPRTGCSDHGNFGKKCSTKFFLFSTGYRIKS